MSSGRQARRDDGDTVAVDERISDAIHGQNRSVRRRRFGRWALALAAGATIWVALTLSSTRDTGSVALNNEESPSQPAALSAPEPEPVKERVVIAEPPAQALAVLAPAPAPAPSSASVASPEPSPPKEPELAKPILSIANARITSSRYSETTKTNFAVGARVWFHTRVQGGQGGEAIEHVWIRDDRAVQRVRLHVGNSNWRTRSYKTMAPSMTGAWAVEARDRRGRVLARHEFNCLQAREAVAAIPVI